MKLQERYNDLEYDTLLNFRKLELEEDLIIEKIEDLKENGWEDTLTYTHGLSGENIDFYPIKISKEKFIHGLNTMKETLKPFNFNDMDLRSQIYLLNVIKNKL